MSRWILLAVGLGLVNVALSPTSALAQSDKKADAKKGDAKKGDAKKADPDKEPQEDPFALRKQLAEVLGLNADKEGNISDEDAKKAVAEAQKQANAKEKTDRSKAILAALDGNKDGKVDDKEAAAGVANARQETPAGKQAAESFAKLDADRNGSVTRKEFEDGLKQLGPFAQFIAPRLGFIFGAMDANRDGSLTAVEFQMGSDNFLNPGRGWGRDRTPPDNRAEQIAKNSMAQLDKDKDGFLTEKEAAKDKTLKGVFKQVDKDASSHVSEAEMIEYLKTTLPPPKQPDRPQFPRPPFGRGKGR